MKLRGKKEIFSFCLFTVFLSNGNNFFERNAFANVLIAVNSKAQFGNAYGEK